MSYFFSSVNLVSGQTLELEGGDVHHILAARRVKPGEVLNLQGPDKKRFFAKVVKADKRLLTVKVLEQLPVPFEPVVGVTLFQAVIAEKALDFILQKGTELGLNRLVLFNSVNTPTRLAPEIFARKAARWNKILVEAAKQSDRVTWPTLEFVDGIKEVMELGQKLDIMYLTDILGQRGFGSEAKPNNVGLIVGPEGGLANTELEEFKALTNLLMVSLGPILLRADTAALASLAVIRNLSL